MKKTTFFVAAVAALLLAGTSVAQTVRTTTTVTTQARPVYRTMVPLRAVPLAAPTLAYTVQSGPAYAVVSEAAAPRVVRGIFRDRVVQPRRPVLSVVEIEE